MSPYPDGSPIPDPIDWPAEPVAEPHYGHTHLAPVVSEPRRVGWWRLVLAAVACAALGYAAGLVVGAPDWPGGDAAPSAEPADPERAALIVEFMDRWASPVVDRCVAERTIDAVGKSEFRWLLDHFSRADTAQNSDEWEEVQALISNRDGGKTLDAYNSATQACLDEYPRPSDR